MNILANEPAHLRSDWEGEAPNKTQLLSALDQTERVSTRIRVYGLYAYALTMLNVFCVIVQSSFHILPWIETLIFTLTIGVFAGVLLGMRDASQRQGDALFEEITDELHWDVSRRFAETASASKASGTRPDLQARLVLRKYSQSTDMPLIKGSVGPLIYFLMNIGCTLAIVLLNRSYVR